jgi:phage shock protein A
MELDGLTREELYHQLSLYMLTEKQLKKSITESIQNYETWKERLQKASDAGRTDLIQAAESELASHRLRLTQLNTELTAFEPEFAALKEAVHRADIKIQGRTSGVDPEALLAALQAQTGKTATDHAFDSLVKDQEAASLLQDLKDRLRDPKSPRE